MLTQLQQMAAQQPERIAVEDRGAGVSYAALWQQVQQLAAALVADDVRVAGLDAPNGAAWVVAHFACALAGVVQVPLPPFFTAAQRTHALQDAGANALLHQPGASAGISISPLPYAAVPLPVGTALITYTSGSTGAPKGVCLSQQGMEQVSRSLLQALGAALAQRHLSVLPLGVLLEQVGGLYPALLAGGTYVVEDAPLPQALAASRATSCILVPELLKLLVQSPLHYPHLRFAAVGGARVDDGLIAQAQQAGLPVYQGYGLSEAASVVALNTPLHAKHGTVGKVLPHIRYTIAADGEILLQNPAMLGYAGDAAWHGAYATGDLGHIDAEGFLTIQGRKKNVLITANGRNISPEWPESLLAAQPEIAQAFVYGDAQPALSALLVPAQAQADMQAAVQRVNAQLPSYAQIAQWQATQPFTVANGMATANGRLRRDAISSTLLKDQNDGFLRPACA
ncbi:MAG: AMP-dependent synthetase [Azospirillum brasilense]|nr:MAG: AMP-dependent synthetase [Azospirillum brasilense]